MMRSGTKQENTDGGEMETHFTYPAQPNIIHRMEGRNGIF